MVRSFRARNDARRGVRNVSTVNPISLEVTDNLGEYSRVTSKPLAKSNAPVNTSFPPRLILSCASSKYDDDNAL